MSSQPASDLRTRIAAVLNSFPADMRPVAVVNIEKADAVIRELGLIEQQSEWPFDGKHRYVTEWETTDE
jgi:hypothetical protein